MNKTSKKRGLNNRNIIGSDTDPDEMDATLTKTPIKANPTKRSATPENRKAFMKGCEMQVKIYLENLENACSRRIKEIELQHKKVCFKFPPDLLDLTFYDFIKLRQVKEKSTTVSTDPAPVSSATLDANTSLQSTNESSSLKHTVAGSLNVPPTVISPAPASLIPQDSKLALQAKLETPGQLVLRKSTRHLNPRVVISKFDPTKPVNPMRWPGNNEMTMSLSGSPVSMPISKLNMINLNVPLQNGQVMAILPQPMSQLTQAPELSEEVLQQLEQIEKNIGIVKQMCLQHRLQVTPNLTALTPIAPK